MYINYELFNSFEMKMLLVIFQIQLSDVEFFKPVYTHHKTETNWDIGDYFLPNVNRAHWTTFVHEKAENLIIQVKTWKVASLN